MYCCETFWQIFKHYDVKLENRKVVLCVGMFDQQWQQQWQQWVALHGGYSLGYSNEWHFPAPAHAKICGKSRGRLSSQEAHVIYLLHCTYNCMSFLSEQCKNLKLCMHHKFINCACLVGVLIAKEDSITHVIGLTVLLDLHLSHRIIIFDNVFHLFVNFLMLSSFYLYKTLFLFEKQEKMTQCLKTIKKCLILNFRAKNRWNWIFNAKIQRIKKG